MPGIYIHIPFCRHACTYCDFHFSTVLASKADMIGAMAKEIQLRAHELPDVELDSLYFGGGTPSVLDPSELNLLMETLHRHFRFKKDAEMTLEVNPEDVNPLVLATWRSQGFNRLSIGLQSFMDEELQWMNRKHSALDSIRSLEQAREAGFSNISIDLIYGSKFQSLASWEETLHKALSLQTTHISSYNLTIEKKTALGVLREKGREPAVDDELSSQQFLRMSEVLQANGFEHYEISNFAKPGYVAVHNGNYWKQHAYLGIGPSAHSFNGNERRWNVSNNHTYIRAIENGHMFWETETLQSKDRYNEYVLTGLRTSWGVNKEFIRTTFGEIIFAHFAEGLKRHKTYLIDSDTDLKLTPEGRLLADGIAADFFIL